MRGDGSPIRDDAWFRWRRWTPLRRITATVWVVLTLGFGLVFWFRAAFIGSAEPGDLYVVAMRMAATNQVIAVAGCSAGPMGIWLVRRTWPWLIASVAAFLAPGLYALEYLRRF